jgi:hypothetical protein
MGKIILLAMKAGRGVTKEKVYDTEPFRYSFLTIKSTCWYRGGVPKKSSGLFTGPTVSVVIHAKGRVMKRLP